MSKDIFSVGFSRVDITPPQGIAVSGYFVPRFAKGILDELKCTSLALALGDKRVLMISVDTLGITTEIGREFSRVIEQKTGVPAKNVFLSATHTHTGGAIFPQEEFDADTEIIAEYKEALCGKICDAASLALMDLREAKMGFGTVKAPDRIAYIRRYKMKDGTTLTCPPINDSDIVGPIGTLDQRVNVLRFDRVGGDTVVLMNYGLHPDTINTDMLSSDWPGFFRDTFETAVKGTKCVFFNGAEGDVGSTNVHPVPGDMNDTEISFDNEMKSYGMCRFVGRALAGAVLQIYDKVAYVPVKKLDIIHEDVHIKSNRPDKSELPLAHKYYDLHIAGRDDLIPYEAMQLTTVVAGATRMIKLENGPDEFILDMTGIRIGDIALIGIPGEPFTEIGVRIKDTDSWSLIMPCALTNGYEGYFPPRSAFDEGGYEAARCNYAPEIADKLVEGGKNLLSRLK